MSFRLQNLTDFSPLGHNTMELNDVCDYVIVKMTEAGSALNLLKLQKLVYYIEAWHLAFHDRGLSNTRFQAWVHGPVSRRLYDRFKDSKSLYSAIEAHDVRSTFNLSALDPAKRRHIDAVLEVYGPFTGSQLEEMTHAEEPWIVARGSCRPSERCETEIAPTLMARYYKARLPAHNEA